MSKIPTRPSYLGNEKIEHLAEEARKTWGFEVGSSIKALVRNLGGNFLYQTHDQADGSLEVRDTGDFTVTLSPLTSELRDVFTVAHELGHYVLHYPLFRAEFPDEIFVAERFDLTLTSDNSLTEAGKIAEREANRFAAAFLMPSSDFEKLWEGKNQNASEVAFHFGVSSQSAETRAKSLGLFKG